MAKTKLPAWKKETKNPHSIFVCFEVIEHMWTPEEIYHYFIKADIDPQAILIYTPFATFQGGMTNWDTRVLGHVRTYTTNELFQFCSKLWPSYNWQIYKSNSMVAVGLKQSGSIFSYPVID